MKAGPFETVGHHPDVTYGTTHLHHHEEVRHGPS